MPSKSFSQARMMAGAAHDPVFAKKVGVPTKVAKEFNKADDKSGFLSSAMRAKGPAYMEGGTVEKMLGPLGSGVLDTVRELKKMKDAMKLRDQLREEKAARDSAKYRTTGGVPSRTAPGDMPGDWYSGRDELRGPERFTKGGGVRGKGAEKRGIRPAKYY